MKRRPVEAIQRRADYGARCERLVLDALAQLTEAGAPFTVEDVCRVAGVGKTFIYDKLRPAITSAVLRARDASQGKPALPLTPEGVTQAEIEALLAVATLYVDSFATDEAMSLPELQRLQDIEDILARHGRRY